MQKSKLLIIAGPNGSGKTTVTSQILKHEWTENCEYINPDDIAEKEFGDWNSPEAVFAAAKKSTERRERFLEEGKSLIFETVFSSVDKLDYIKRAKAKGYFIRLFFVCTNSPIINAQRVANRVLQGGHDVPIRKIISRYQKSIINCCLISKIVDRFVYDNSIDNQNAILLFRATNGILEKQYNEINGWAKSIFEVNNLKRS